MTSAEIILLIVAEFLTAQRKPREIRIESLDGATEVFVEYRHGLSRAGPHAFFYVFGGSLNVNVGDRDGRDSFSVELTPEAIRARVQDTIRRLSK